jgi:hypothetical protein
MITVRVPKRFIEDHEDRSLIRIADVLVRELKYHYIVSLTDAQASELLSDADHYRDGGGGGMDMKEALGLISSAKATYNALIKAGLEPIAQPKSVY